MLKCKKLKCSRCAHQWLVLMLALRNPVGLVFCVLQQRHEFVVSAAWFCSPPALSDDDAGRQRNCIMRLVTHSSASSILYAVNRECTISVSLTSAVCWALLRKSISAVTLPDARTGAKNHAFLHDVRAESAAVCQVPNPKPTASRARPFPGLRDS